MTAMNYLSPRQIVAELDRFIVGQQDAKRAVAVALRNRWRRQQLPEGLREEVLPKNIYDFTHTSITHTILITYSVYTFHSKNKSLINPSYSHSL